MTEEPEDSRPDEDEADIKEDGPPVTEAGGDYEQEEPRSTADEPGDPGREA